eukprot:scaffold209399_cov30-Tisochrysis_lutea.AAC.1
MPHLGSGRRWATLRLVIRIARAWSERMLTARCPMPVAVRRKMLTQPGKAAQPAGLTRIAA